MYTHTYTYRYREREKETGYKEYTVNTDENTYLYYILNHSQLITREKTNSNLKNPAFLCTLACGFVFKNKDTFSASELGSK